MFMAVPSMGRKAFCAGDSWIIFPMRVARILWKGRTITDETVIGRQLDAFVKSPDLGIKVVIEILSDLGRFLCQRIILKIAKRLSFV